MAFGIAGYAVSLPRLRIQRERIAAAHEWAVPSLAAGARGERTFCNADEDCLTLAVNAANRCVERAPKRNVSFLGLSSTTFPFIDRQQATLVADALNLGSELQTLDAGNSQRAATSLLLQALERGAKAADDSHLIVAADALPARPGSVAEMRYGDGAAALMTGNDAVAEFLGGVSVSHDFVDHYRAAESIYDYRYEDRWIRDEAESKFYSEACNNLLAQTAVDANQIDFVIVPVNDSRAARRVLRECGLDDATAVDTLTDRFGYCGVAHPFLMLANALDTAKAGQHVMLFGFGQGVDALLFKTTERIGELTTSGDFSAGYNDCHYTRFAGCKGELKMDWGMRSERDNRTAMSVYYRKHSQINGFIGGRCTRCKTIQFPKSRICVAPDCGAENSQEDYQLSNASGKVKSFTEDWLGYSPAPPLKYGNVQFDNGANVMMEFCDFEPGELQVGTAVRPAFRVKDVDTQRGFRRYFWKAQLEEST